MVLLQLHFGFLLGYLLGHLVFEKAQVCFAALFVHISIRVCFFFKQHVAQSHDVQRVRF